MWREPRVAEATTALQSFLFTREIDESDLAEDAREDLVYAHDVRIRDSFERTSHDAPNFPMAASSPFSFP